MNCLEGGEVMSRQNVCKECKFAQQLKSVLTALLTQRGAESSPALRFWEMAFPEADRRALNLSHQPRFKSCDSRGYPRAGLGTPLGYLRRKLSFNCADDPR